MPPQMPRLPPLINKRFQLQNTAIISGAVMILELKEVLLLNYKARYRLRAYLKSEILLPKFIHILFWT